MFIWFPHSFPESCFCPKPRRSFPWLAEGAAGASITPSMTGATRVKPPLSPRQPQPSSTLGWGTLSWHSPAPLLLPGHGGRLEHTCTSPMFSFTEAFPLHWGHSPAVLFALELSVQRKAILQKYCFAAVNSVQFLFLQKYCFAAAPPLCLLYPHWLPKQGWGCFGSLCRAHFVPMYSIFQ